MTEYEKIVVSAYTGILMCDFAKVHEYIEKKLGRPVLTHEIDVWDREVKPVVREGFLKICQADTVTCEECVFQVEGPLWCSCNTWGRSIDRNGYCYLGERRDL